MFDEEFFLEGKTTVLLDLDGTLVDSVEPHARSWQDVLQKHDHNLELYDLKRMIGMGGDKLVKAAIGEVGEKELEEITDERSEIFREKYLNDVYPFRKVNRLIHALRERGLTVYLATASSPEDRDALLKRGGLENEFHDFVSSDKVEGSKPEPDLIHAILKKLDVHPHHCVLVGDSPFDAKAAAGAEVDFIGVESGCYTRDELPNTIQVFPSVTEFAETLAPSTSGSAL